MEMDDIPSSLSFGDSLRDPESRPSWKARVHGPLSHHDSRVKVGFGQDSKDLILSLFSSGFEIILDDF